MLRQRLPVLLFCLFAPSAARIVGGKFTTIAQHPYMVSVRNENDVHVCGGSIISKRTVLTAAHCLILYPNASAVVAGRTYLKERARDGQTRRIDWLLPHEKFSLGSHANDIGLIGIRGEFGFGRHVQPVALRHEEARPGEEGVVAGWGLGKVVRQEEGDSDTKKIDDELEVEADEDVPLAQVRIPILSMEECQKRFAKVTILDQWICAQDHRWGKDTCTGDSGGPLVVGRKQVGVIAWGIGCGYKYPGLYTKVLSFKDWIEKHVV